MLLYRYRHDDRKESGSIFKYGKEVKKEKSYIRIRVVS